VVEKHVNPKNQNVLLVNIKVYFTIMLYLGGEARFFLALIYRIMSATVLSEEQKLNNKILHLKRDIDLLRAEADTHGNIELIREKDKNSLTGEELRTLSFFNNLEKKEKALKKYQEELSEIKPTSRTASVSPTRSARGSIFSRLNPFRRHGGKNKTAKKQRKTRKNKKSKRATRKH